mgnify:CR=1 FL=1
MKLAFVYAGQGSQKVGMGRDFYDRYPEYRAVLDNAGLDFDLKALSFEGPIEELSQTRYTQPCMAAFAVGVTDLLYAGASVPVQRRACPWGSTPPCMPPACWTGRRC